MFIQLTLVENYPEVLAVCTGKISNSSFAFSFSHDRMNNACRKRYSAVARVTRLTIITDLWVYIYDRTVGIIFSVKMRAFGHDFMLADFAHRRLPQLRNVVTRNSATERGNNRDNVLNANLVLRCRRHILLWAGRHSITRAASCNFWGDKNSGPQRGLVAKRALRSFRVRALGHEHISA